MANSESLETFVFEDQPDLQDYDSPFVLKVKLSAGIKFDNFSPQQLYFLKSLLETRFFSFLTPILLEASWAVALE